MKNRIYTFDTNFVFVSSISKLNFVKKENILLANYGGYLSDLEDIFWFVDELLVFILQKVADRPSTILNNSWQNLAKLLSRFARTAKKYFVENLEIDLKFLTERKLVLNYFTAVLAIVVFLDLLSPALVSFD